MILVLSEEELEEADAALEAAMSGWHGRHYANSRFDQRDALRIGIRAERAAAHLLGLEPRRPEDYTRSIATDCAWRGRRLEVKSAGRPDADFNVVAVQEFTADIGLLVLPMQVTVSPLAFTAVGWVDQARYLEHRFWNERMPKPAWSVAQRNLLPISQLLSMEEVA